MEITQADWDWWVHKIEEYVFSQEFSQPYSFVEIPVEYTYKSLLWVLGLSVTKAGCAF